MKVLMINKFLYPNGGSETYMFELGKQLERTAQELLTVSRHPRHFVCVCDELWRDGVTYEPWTEHYRRGLAEICRALAAEFDAVAELAAGCVRVWKGELPDA